MVEPSIETSFNSLEHRIRKLEKYVADQEIKSKDFGKRFALLEATVAALIKPAITMEGIYPQ